MLRGRASNQPGGWRKAAALFCLLLLNTGWAASVPVSAPLPAGTDSPPVVKPDTGEPTPGAVAPRPPDRYYVTASRLNLRQGPGRQFAAVAELERGTAVDRLEETHEPLDGRWFRVRSQARGTVQEGWVAALHVGRPGTPDTRVPGSGDFAHLNYAAREKRSHPGNPRRDVRGLYVSFNALSSARFADLVDLVRQTSINALVIDFKDDVGGLLIPSATAGRLNPAANRHVQYKDLAEVLRPLRALDTYLIARIVVFKDPIYAREHPPSAIVDQRTGQAYRSRDGLTWSSPYDANFRAYNLGLAEEAAAAGFHEVQFDYVRFPDVSRDVRLDYRTTSGQTKAEVVQNFLLEARRRLEPRRVYLAADVFGLVCTTVDDMRIGQYWEAVSAAVDYICPMMYPSHYANQSYGLAVPDRHPFELIDRGVADAVRRNRNVPTPAELRPWLQGFTASWVKGHRSYGPAEVKAQVKALHGRGVHSWLIWHPGGRYDAAAYR